MGLSVPSSIPTYYYEISSDDFSPAQSPVQQQKTSVSTAMLHEVFPIFDYGQASLLLDLYNNNIYVTEALLDGIAMNASMLLYKFRAVRQTSRLQHIAVRPDHIVEEGCDHSTREILMWNT